VREGWLSAWTGGCEDVGADGLPLPPCRQRLLVDGRSSGAEHFLRVGGQMAEAIRVAVAATGAEIGDLEAILDFGCGCGRVARHWATTEGPEIHGCDYNEELVTWCAGNLPFVHAIRNELEPPLPYAAQSFDLIYALSVLSHLREPLQHAWIAEFRRLLRPGGLLVLSVLGERVRDRMTGAERRCFERGELVVERPRMSGRNLCTAYHPRRYVRERLLGDFAAIEPFDLGGPELVMRQDAYVARL
jgi:SAM-dependent methyltransferase